MHNSKGKLMTVNSSMIFDWVTLAEYTLLEATAHVRKSTRPNQAILLADLSLWRDG